AFASDETLPDPRAAARRAALLVLAALVLVITLVLPLGSSLPGAIDPSLSPDAASRPRIVGTPGVLVVQALTMLLFAAAAYGFGRRAERTGDELSSWLAVAATLGSFARLNYLLFPSLYSEWVYTGDFLRLGFFVLLCAGAAREIMRTQRLQAEALMIEDRRRMAREIHDGLAQELAFIASQTQRLGPRTIGRREEQATLVRQLRDAAQRALDESRAAIEVLTLGRDEHVSDAVCRAAENVGERYGARVHVDVADGFDTSRAARDAMVRIVREAVTNAVRHGEARTVRVEMRGPHPVVLRVRDDGKGFDAAAATGSGGFGLTSMRERARALGGELEISSAPGEGATVEVRIP
ncbi:MAG TPA: sensor histidine kinase, partial [Solirubrobacteraceae bacterium]|nr:sensor histidine kinase [Solirubrobacteraceae bacterium]